MSEYIAEAKVRVLPDLSKFTADLTQDLNQQITKFNATSAKQLKPIQVPVQAGAIASKGLTQSVSQTTSALNKQVKSTGVLGGSMGRLDRQIGNTRAKMLGLGSATARVDAALLGLRTAVGSTAVIGLGAGALAAIALGNALRRTIGITVEFERELNTFQAVTGASANEMERVAAAAKQLGADVTLPAVSAADAAVAMAELAKAGLSVQDAIDGARGVLQLATAANIGFADAVELAASALNAFELTGKDAVRVADTLANAANSAQGSISDIGIALQQAAAVGRQAGLSFEDTTLFLTQLARAGLRSSDAGTSLRTALIRLINPTAKAAAIIDELGVSIRDEAGNIRPDIFLQFANAMRGMSDETRDAKLAIIGGQDALRAFAILGRGSTKDFLALRAELRQQGTAAEVAAARTKGLGGSFQALQSTLETLGITLGQKVAPGFTDFVNGVTASVDAISQSEGVAAGLSAAMEAVAAAFSAVGAVATTVGPLLLGIANATAGITNAFGSQLVTALLATVVALKAYSFAAKTATVNTIALQVALLRMNFRSAAASAAAAGTALTVFGRAAIFSRAAVAALAASFNFWLVGAVALGAGVLYLASRESQAEKATRSLKEASDALAKSLDQAKTAAEGAASAQRTSASGGLAVSQARLAKAQAQSALASSNAAKGSIERRQLEINLAVAIQDVTFATQAYEKALQDLVIAREANRDAQAAVRQAQEDEIDAIQGVISATEKQVELEQRRPKRPGGFTDIQLEAKGRERLVATLRKQAAQEKLSDDAAVRAGAKRKQLLADVIATTKRIPKQATIEIIVKQKISDVVKNIVEGWRQAGFSSAQTYERYLLAGLGIAKDNVSAYLRGPFADAVTRASREALDKAGKEGAKAFAGALTFDEALAAAQARGASNAELLAIARAEQAKAAAAFNKISAATAGGTKFRDQTQEDAFNAAVERKNAADDKVKQILGDITSAAKDQQAKAKDAQDAQNEAGQALFEVLTSTGKGIRALNKKLEDAGVTPTLTDDIKFTKILLAVYKKIRSNLRKRLLDLGVSAAEVERLLRAITDLINDTARDLKKLRQDQADAIREANEAARDALMAKFDAQIRFFEAKDNIAGQIKARTARLKAITAQLAKLKNAGKRYTAAWWDLKAQQAEEIAAIKELKGQTKEKNKEQAALMFAFLQAQQGFAANLLGNVIGLGATSGLVGNISAGGAATAGGTAPGIRTGLMPEDRRTNLSPGGDLVTQSQISAGAKLGVSRGQGTAQTEILRQILDTLKDIKRGQGFPEARYQATRASAAQDTGGGGGVQSA